MNSIARRAARAVASCLLLAALVGCSQQDLFTNSLNESQANRVVAELRKAGLEAEKISSRDGKSFSISTSKEDFARAVDVLDANGLPRPVFSSRGEVFKDPGLAPSPTAERARYSYGLSQELSNKLSNISGVVYADVTLSIPEKNPLADKPPLATAAVLIKHRYGMDLTQEVGKIKGLVVNSVDGLPYDNVTVAMVSADPLPPALPRPPMTVMWGNYGALVLGGGIGVAVLVIGLAVWARQRHSSRSRRAHGGDDGQRSVAVQQPKRVASSSAPRPPLRTVGMNPS